MKTLKAIRKICKKNQQELAFELDSTQTYLSMIESGKHSPRVDFLLRILDVLQLPRGLLPLLVMTKEELEMCKPLKLLLAIYIDLLVDPRDQGPRTLVLKSLLGELDLRGLLEGKLL